MTIWTLMLFHDIAAIDERPILNNSKRLNIIMRQIDHTRDHRNIQSQYKPKPRCCRNGWANEY